MANLADTIASLMDNTPDMADLIAGGAAAIGFEHLAATAEVDFEEEAIRIGIPPGQAAELAALPTDARSHVLAQIAEIYRRRTGTITVLDVGQSYAGFVAAVRAALPAERRYEVQLVRFSKSRGWRRHVRRMKSENNKHG